MNDSQVNYMFVQLKKVSGVRIKVYEYDGAKTYDTQNSEGWL